MVKTVLKNTFIPILLLSGIVLGSIILVSNAFSEEKEKKKELPKSGTLASTSGGGTSASAGGFGQTALSEDDKTPPIGGSVYRNKNTWLAKVFNNSKDTVSGTFKVIQVGKSGSAIKSDTFSATLAGGKSVERSFSASPMSMSGSLEVVSWKSNKIETDEAEDSAEKESGEDSSETKDSSSPQG